ncbi:MAG TPA: pyridoxamine 5'-phosphate oxidase family protein [Holophagaceae bacterium]|nr:pyridoxamine 5'-phosphate oxidase family protein [Holophagaceae bacterium]
MPHHVSRASLADQAAFLEGGRSINVGSCDAEGRPSLSRALGCRVSREEGRVTVFLARLQCEALLRDIAARGRIAVVFSEPPTHRTLQLKGSDAEVVAIRDGDAAWVEGYVRAFAQELVPLGFIPEVIQAIFACPPSELAAVTFTPTDAFDQTPGPQAGAQLEWGP